MLKETIKYTNYNGEEVTEDFYFHLNKAQIAEMEASVDGGYSAKLQRIAESRDGAEIMKLIKEFILRSYGIKSEDGRFFRKSEELSKDFEQTEAYSELFIKLCTDTNEAIRFISGIFPFTDEQRKEFAKQATVSELPAPEN